MSELNVNDVLPIVRRAAEIGCITSTALFAGVALAYNCIIIPGLKEASSEVGESTRHWGVHYEKGKNTQIKLIAGSALTGALATYLGSPRAFLYAGGIIALNAPYTLLCIMPTNAKLLDLGKQITNLEKKGDSGEKGKKEKVDKEREASVLIEHWTKLHSVRTVLGISAVALIGYAFTKN
ncbi:uncharacterized protein VTP21DRAFT_7477 [Calcarisporiella thermophila]|uniref:uncharacterized protein n=1 Tax=Calcarisporiella thermophila TaxID=911321 RepID=UPI00374375E0